MRKLLPCMSALALFFVALPGYAWFGAGHMVVAYIAYQNLTPELKSRIDDLLKLNDMYAAWTDGVADNEKAMVAFVKAATWPDCIKQKSCSPGYKSLGGDTPPGNATDAQNIGYADKLTHAYWHFVDLPYAAGAPGQPPKVPNALTEIQLLTKAISSSESDDIKSYDVVWLEHLVGDVHQPLHATSRFTKNHPNGDAGGNLVYLCAKPCKDELHAYWDGLLGDDLTIDQVKQTGDRLLMAGKPEGTDKAMPRTWINESFALAKSAAYAKPISSDNQKGVSPRPDAGYQMNATGIAEARVTLAGYRLAALLTNNLK